MVSHISNPIIAIRQLLSYSPIVKEFLKFTKNNFNFDWEATITEKPEIFVFTNLEFVKQNIDGGPWFHIIVTEKDVIILSRDEENADEFYTDHIIFGTHYKPSRIINRIKPLYIISCNIIDFKTIQKTNRHYSSDYDEYKYHVLKEKRLEKCLELQLFKLVYSLCENLPSIIELRNESTYFNFIQNKVQEIINSEQIKKWCWPITNIKFELIDFEVTIYHKRFFIENKLDYSFLKDDKLVIVKYNTLYPSHYRFKQLLYPDHFGEIIIATVFDNILQIIGGFNMTFKDNKKAMIIRNICNNGFSKEYVAKFRHLL